MFPHDPEECRCILGGYDGDELTLIGDVNGIEAQHLARGAHLGLERDVLFAQSDAQLREIVDCALPQR